MGYLLIKRKEEMNEEERNNDEISHADENDAWIPEPSPQFSGTPEPETRAEVKLKPVTAFTPPPLLPSDERMWAMLAHMSVLLNLVTGFLGAIAAIVIYYSYKDRSRLVAYHAMQAFIFQAITWLGAGLLAGLFIGLGSAFAILIIPLLCLIPGFLFLLFIPISLIYGVIGGVKVNNGEDFRYWQVGDWVRDILEPKPVQKT
jgi:uncharacterized protein